MATLSNTGNAPLTNIAVSITGANAYMFQVYPNGSCYGMTTLPQDSACTISVDFYPPGPGSFAATLTVTDNAANSPQTSALTGSGTESELQFSPGQFNIVAGTPGTAGATGSGPANAALIGGGYGIALDTTGLQYFSDYTNNTVWQIDDNGNINVYAGMPSTTGGYGGDNGNAPSAQLSSPEQIAFDPAGNLYIADRQNNIVRVVNSAGTITTFAGQDGKSGETGDGGSANQATLTTPYGVASDAQGNIYIADTGDNVVRKVDLTGAITLFAGTPNQSGNTGDGGPATSATLGQIYQLATDLSGNVYIADFSNGVVRKVDTDGNISTYAGGGAAAVTTTPQLATGVNLNAGPQAITTDPAGNLYIVANAGASGNQIYVVNTSQQIVWFAGGGSTILSGIAANAEETNATAVAVDYFGDVYVNDAANHIVSEIDPDGDLAFPSTPAKAISAPLTVTLSNTGNAPLSFSNQYDDDVVRKQSHAAPPRSRTAARSARPDVVDFNSYGTIAGPFLIASGGTCNFDDGIAAGASCTMNVTFNPTSPGAATGTITLYTYQDGYSTNPNTILLSGTATQALAPGATLTPSQSFPNTITGTTSSVVAATLSNTGTGPLTITSIAVGVANPSVFTLSTGTNACGATLAAGATCNIYVTFAPESTTSFSASLTVTDNANPTTQSITLTGTGIPQMPQAINFTQPASVTYSPTLTVSLVATGGASGSPVVFTIDSTSTGAGTISGSRLTVTGTGSFVIDANQAGNADYFAAPPVQRTFAVNPAPQAINFTQPASPVTYSSGLTVPLVATGGASGNAVVFTIDQSSTATGSISGSTLTVTGTGSLVIDANQPGNANYSAAPQVQRTLVVNAPIPQAINFTQPASPVTYAPNLTVSLVATGGGSGNPVIFTIDAGSTGTGSISGSTLTIAGVGKFVIDANQAGNSTYTAAPQVQRAVVVNQAPQAINFTQPASVVFSAGLTITLTATGGASGNAVVFTLDESSTAAGSISGNTVTVTSAGNLVIDANQAGNADYSAAAQAQRTVLVNPPPPDFTISAAPPSQTIAAGASTEFTVTITATNGNFSNPVTLSATGLPIGANGTFQPATINPGTGNGTSTFTVQLAPALQASAHGPSSWPLATPALALLFLLPFRRWRKAWRGKLLLLIAGLVSLASMVSLTGCGGGFLLGSPQQTYTVTITGASGNDTHSTTVQLTVK
jgi:hypothetical protein